MRIEKKSGDTENVRRCIPFRGLSSVAVTFRTSTNQTVSVATCFKFYMSILIIPITNDFTNLVKSFLLSLPSHAYACTHTD